MLTMLWQRINVYRGVEGTKRDFVPGDEHWPLMFANVPARLDPVYHYRSNIQTLPEELVGREEALLFTMPNKHLMVRDIIVVVNDPTGLLTGRQYDIGFFNPTSGLSSMHHVESTVFFRDNAVVLS